MTDEKTLSLFSAAKAPSQLLRVSSWVEAMRLEIETQVHPSPHFLTETQKLDWKERSSDPIRTITPTQDLKQKKGKKHNISRPLKNPTSQTTKNPLPKLKKLQHNKLKCLLAEKHTNH